MGQLNLSSGVNLQGSGNNWGTNTNLPKGSILQQVHYTNTGELATQSNSFQSWTSQATNITPISSSSHLWIFMNAIRCQVYRNGNEALIRMTDGTNSTAEYRLRNYDSDDDYLPFTPCHNWYWAQTHTAGTQITITPQMRNTDGSNWVIWGDNGSPSTMIIQEIAQ